MMIAVGRQGAIVRGIWPFVAAALLVISGSLGCKSTPLSKPASAGLPSQAPLPSRPEGTQEAITVTIVYDNYQYDPNLRTSWGFSCLVDGLEKAVLFDTGGDGNLLLANMDKLRISPEDIDVVVLSHIHGDHTGGLTAFLGHNPHVTVFVPQSFPASFKQAITKTGAQYVEVGESTQICPHAVSTGELGTSIKEQALILETANGLVVITGCAHPGVVNMVRRAKEVLNKDIHLVMGGFHMSGFSAAQVNRVIRELQQLGVQKAAPCHCSGDQTRQIFAQVYGEDFVKVGVGKKLEFTPAD